MECLRMTNVVLWNGLVQQLCPLCKRESKDGRRLKSILHCLHRACLAKVETSLQGQAQKVASVVLSPKCAGKIAICERLDKSSKNLAVQALAPRNAGQVRLWLLRACILLSFAIQVLHWSTPCENSKRSGVPAPKPPNVAETRRERAKRMEKLPRACTHTRQPKERWRICFERFPCA